MQETRLQVETGADWLARQSEERQLAQMGPAKFAAWKDGEISVADMVRRTHSPAWGTTRSEKSLKDILQEKHGEEGGAKLAAKYLGPVRSAAGVKAAGTRAAGGGGRGRGGKPTRAGGRGAGSDDGEGLRRQRLGQLSRMTDQEFRHELESFRVAEWNPRRLRIHLEKHGEQLGVVLGVNMDEAKLKELASETLRSADMVLTGIDRATREIEYAFIRQLSGSMAPDDAIIALVRSRIVRSVFPAAMERWLKRRADMVEVTGRVQSLG